MSDDVDLELSPDEAGGLPERLWRSYMVKRLDRFEEKVDTTNGRVTELERDRIKRDAIRRALIVGIPLGGVLFGVVVESLRASGAFS